MDYIIILGSDNPDICDKRCEVGALYFKKNCVNVVSEYGDVSYSGTIICSGGGNGKRSEAEYMKTILIDEWNIPIECIGIETKSQNTEENFLNCRSMFISSKMIGSYTNDNWISSIIICTSTFHIKRSYVIALDVFLHDKIGSIKTIHTNEFVSYDLIQSEVFLLDNYLHRKLFLK